MTIDDLRALHAALPKGSAVTLSRRAVGELLEALEGPEATAESRGDLDLPQVAERVGRAVSTVRGWCSSGALSGAYKLNGRDWRIPPRVLEAFLRRQSGQAEDARRAPREPSDLAAWRSEMPLNKHGR